jgi:hypothetical protein
VKVAHCQPRHTRRLPPGRYENVHKAYIAVLLRAFGVDEAGISAVYDELADTGSFVTPTHSFERDGSMYTVIRT